MDFPTDKISDYGSYYEGILKKDWEEITSIFPDKEFLLTKIKNKHTLVKIFKRTRKINKNSSRIRFSTSFLKIKLVYCDHSQYGLNFKKTYLVFGNIRSVLNFISKKYRKESANKELISIHVKNMKFKSLSGDESCC